MAPSTSTPDPVSSETVESAPPTSPSSYFEGVLPIVLKYKRFDGYSYEATISSLPMVTAEKYVADSPPGSARVVSTLNGNYAANVVGLDEGRNGSPQSLDVILVYSTPSEEMAPDLGGIGLTPLCNNASGGGWRYLCGVSGSEGTEFAPGNGLASPNMPEATADYLTTQVFTEGNAQISVSPYGASACLLIIDPVRGTAEMKDLAGINTTVKDECLDFSIG
ncbi:MAG: hypothetical protein QG671_879 [Actinomycetota bacterium]|nr:hypothetical protein [Actinomycetota bacterium]